MNRRDAEKASTCRRLLYMVAELAATFVDRFPDIAKEAMGRDSEYVRWYRGDAGGDGAGRFGLRVC